MKKVISSILLVLVIIFMLSNVVFADKITDSMKDWDKGSEDSFLTNIGSNLYGIILIVGSAVAIGMIAIMAIKFMTSGAEEKAQVKKNLIGFTIGAIILLCATTILGILQSMGQSIN